MQKENVLFFSFPNASSFDGAGVSLQGGEGSAFMTCSCHGQNTDFPSLPLGRMNPTERGMKKKRQKKSVFLPTKHRFLGIFFVLVIGGKSTEGAIDDRQGCYPGLSSSIVYQPSEGDRTCYLFSISYILVSVAPSGLSLL